MRAVGPTDVVDATQRNIVDIEQHFDGTFVSYRTESSFLHHDAVVFFKQRIIVGFIVLGLQCYFFAEHFSRAYYQDFVAAVYWPSIICVCFALFITVLVRYRSPEEVMQFLGWPERVGWHARRATLNMASKLWCLAIFLNVLAFNLRIVRGCTGPFAGKAAVCLSYLESYIASTKQAAPGLYPLHPSLHTICMLAALQVLSNHPLLTVVTALSCFATLVGQTWTLYSWSGLQGETLDLAVTDTVQIALLLLTLCWCMLVVCIQWPVLRRTQFGSSQALLAQFEDFKRVNGQLRDAEHRATENLQAKLDLEHAQQKERADMLRYLFHEIRVPLNTVHMGLQILGSEDANLDAEQAEHVLMMQAACATAVGTLSDALDLAKLERSQNTPPPLKPVNIRDLLQSALLQNKPFAVGNRVAIAAKCMPPTVLQVLAGGIIPGAAQMLRQLSASSEGGSKDQLVTPGFDQGPGSTRPRGSPSALLAASQGGGLGGTAPLPLMPEWVLADAQGLTQVLNNFITNAIKFTPKDGTGRVTIWAGISLPAHVSAGPLTAEGEEQAVGALAADAALSGSYVDGLAGVGAGAEGSVHSGKAAGGSGSKGGQGGGAAGGVTSAGLKPLPYPSRLVEQIQKDKFMNRLHEHGFELVFEREQSSGGGASISAGGTLLTRAHINSGAATSSSAANTGVAAAEGDFTTSAVTSPDAAIVVRPSSAEHVMLAVRSTWGNKAAGGGVGVDSSQGGEGRDGQNVAESASGGGGASIGGDAGEGDSATTNSSGSGRRVPLLAQVVLAVIDNGAGIASEEFPKLYKAFQQLDAGIDYKGRGTGLGLAITKGIVGRMQGRVGVRSTLGVGSVFYITLRLPVVLRKGTLATLQKTPLASLPQTLSLLSMPSAAAVSGASMLSNPSTSGGSAGSGVLGPHGSSRSRGQPSSISSDGKSIAPLAASAGTGGSMLLPATGAAQDSGAMSASAASASGALPGAGIQVGATRTMNVGGAVASAVSAAESAGSRPEQTSECPSSEPAGHASSVSLTAAACLSGAVPQDSTTGLATGPGAEAGGESASLSAPAGGSNAPTGIRISSLSPALSPVGHGSRLLSQRSAASGTTGGGGVEERGRGHTQAAQQQHSSTDGTAYRSPSPVSTSDDSAASASNPSALGLQSTVYPSRGGGGAAAASGGRRAHRTWSKEWAGPAVGPRRGGQGASVQRRDEAATGIPSVHISITDVYTEAPGPLAPMRSRVLAGAGSPEKTATGLAGASDVPLRPARSSTGAGTGAARGDAPLPAAQQLSSRALVASAVCGEGRAGSSHSSLPHPVLHGPQLTYVSRDGRSSLIHTLRQSSGHTGLEDDRSTSSSSTSQQDRGGRGRGGGGRQGTQEASGQGRDRRASSSSEDVSMGGSSRATFTSVGGIDLPHQGSVGGPRQVYGAGGFRRASGSGSGGGRAGGTAGSAKSGGRGENSQGSSTESTVDIQLLGMRRNSAPAGVTGGEGSRAAAAESAGAGVGTGGQGWGQEGRPWTAQDARLAPALHHHARVDTEHSSSSAGSEAEGLALGAAASLILSSAAAPSAALSDSRVGLGAAGPGLSQSFARLQLIGPGLVQLPSSGASTPPPPTAHAPHTQGAQSAPTTPLAAVARSSKESAEERFHSAATMHVGRTIAVGGGGGGAGVYGMGSGGTAGGGGGGVRLSSEAHPPGRHAENTMLFNRRNDAGAEGGGLLSSPASMSNDGGSSNGSNGSRASSQDSRPRSQSHCSSRAGASDVELSETEREVMEELLEEEDARVDGGSGAGGGGSTIGSVVVGVGRSGSCEPPVMMATALGPVALPSGTAGSAGGVQGRFFAARVPPPIDTGVGHSPIRASKAYRAAPSPATTTTAAGGGPGLVAAGGEAGVGVPGPRLGRGSTGLALNLALPYSMGHGSLAVSEATAVSVSSPAVLPSLGPGPAATAAAVVVGRATGQDNLPAVAQLLVTPQARAASHTPMQAQAQAGQQQQHQQQVVYDAGPSASSRTSTSSSPAAGNALFVTHYTPGHPSLEDSAVRILVVDDVVSNRRMLAKLFIKKWRVVLARGEGGVTCEDAYGAVACVEAENGVQALEIMTRYGADFFHAVLMDGSMPEMDGYECTRCMRRGVPEGEGAAGTEQRFDGFIMGLTGNALPVDIAAFLDSGADDVMIKPADVELLCTKITAGLAARAAPVHLA